MVTENIHGQNYDFANTIRREEKGRIEKKANLAVIHSLYDSRIVDVKKFSIALI